MAAGHLSLSKAIWEVLSKANGPLHYKDIATKIDEDGLCAGKPCSAASVNAIINGSLNKRKDVFKKVGRGKFTLNAPTTPLLEPIPSNEEKAGDTDAARSRPDRAQVGNSPRVSAKKSKLIQFEVSGPYEITTTRQPNGARSIETHDKSKFAARHSDALKGRGVYVYAIKATKGFTPWYIGKATKSFEKECFVPEKLGKYHKALHQYTQRVTPVLFLVAHPKQRGAVHKKAIGLIEKELISYARQVNSRLINKHHNKDEEWAISGVIRAKQGQPSTSAKLLKRLLGLT